MAGGGSCTQIGANTVSEHPRPLLLDVDTGVDDAVAITLASRLERHKLVALTTVAGNVPIEYSTDSTLRVVDWLGLDVPVYRGMSRPLVAPLATAREHHGYTGLGSWTPPEAHSRIERATAPEAIVQTVRANEGNIALAFVGPLTNLAVALALEPRLPEMVSKLVIMGGAFFSRGNMTDLAEFNIYVDPEAAALVARAGFDALWVGLDATRQTQLTADDWKALADADEPAEVLVREVMRRSFEEVGRSGFPLHDPLAVALVEEPEIATTRRGAVRVSLEHGSRGETRVGAVAVPDVEHGVADQVNVQRFFRLFGKVCPRLTKD
ncbi:MAG: nucleoside hydrolase [Chloroflexi bacterium]|nr:MAG: nucleoside hydrolase [Chloroflexota bacterium]